jgi:hypothetical protein
MPVGPSTLLACPPAADPPAGTVENGREFSKTLVKIPEMGEINKGNQM